jgi:AraC family L-rhamnose operon transcriptional activator RhaR
MLLHSDESIACIGRAVGWPDQNYFARRFRTHYGLTATAYRTSFSVCPERNRRMPVARIAPAAVGSPSHDDLRLPAYA